MASSDVQATSTRPALITSTKIPRAQSNPSLRHDLTDGNSNPDIQQVQPDEIYNLGAQSHGGEL